MKTLTVSGFRSFLAARSRDGEWTDAQLDRALRQVAARRKPDAANGELATKAFDKNKHPRDKNGRFVSGAAIASAASDPAARAKLESTLDDANKAKLDAAIGDHKSGHGVGKPAAKESQTADSQPKPDSSAAESGNGEHAAKAAAEYKKLGTKAPAFKEWFGDWQSDPANASKVVNADGEPQETSGTAKKVFHGGPVGIDEFRKDKQRDAAVGNGFYFAENRKIAEAYASMAGVTGGSGAVVESYLSIKNPFDMDARLSTDDITKLIGKSEAGPKTKEKFIDSLHSQLDTAGTVSGKQVWDALAGLAGKANVNDVLATMGHDGIRHTAGDMDGSVSRDPSDPKKNFGTVWIAFAPTQIKAVGNLGTFDPKNANIHKAFDDADAKRFDPQKHPRGKDGHFIDAGKIAEAASDPAKRKELEGNLDADNKKKLAGAITAHKKTGGGKPDAKTPTVGATSKEGAPTPAKPSNRADRSGELHDAKRVIEEIDGKKVARVVMADGSPAPEHITPAMIRTDAENVKISKDPSADVQATFTYKNAKTGKTMAKSVYSDEFTKRNAGIKFARVMEGVSKSNELLAEFHRDRAGDDPVKKENADVAWLMKTQATRPGSEGDTKGLAALYGKPLMADDVLVTPPKKAGGVPGVQLLIDGKKLPVRDEGAARELAERKESGQGLFDTTYWLKSHGATTLEARHIVEAPDGVRLQFMGKESVWHDHLVGDKDLAAMLLSRKQAAETKGGPATQLFDTDAVKVRDYVGSADGGGFLSKDMRTVRANELAVSHIQSMPEPNDEDEYHAQWLEVGKRVSSVLGNAPKMSLSNYISPEVFLPWRR